jgi:hypothetical protein
MVFPPLRSIPVSYVAVAYTAIQLLRGTRIIHLTRHYIMAADTVLLHDFLIKLPDLNGIREIPGCESQTVVPAVQSFYDIFTDNIFWSVTTVAVGGFFMTGLVPRIKLFPHDMAVHTGFRIIKKVGTPLCIIKSKNTQAK